MKVTPLMPQTIQINKRKCQLHFDQHADLIREKSAPAAFYTVNLPAAPTCHVVALAKMEAPLGERRMVARDFLPFLTRHLSLVAGHSVRNHLGTAEALDQGG